MEFTELTKEQLEKLKKKHVEELPMATPLFVF